MAAKTKKRSPASTLREATDALKGLDETFLECRDLRHAYQNHGYFRDDGHVARILQCMRCDMQRIDRWLPNGVRETPIYRAPEGYSLVGAHVTPFDVRVEVLRRARGQIYASEDALIGEE